MDKKPSVLNTFTFNPHKISAVTRDESIREKVGKFVQENALLLADKPYQFKLSRLLADVETTDTGNSIRFAARFGHLCKYVPEPDKWYCWNGKTWVKDEIGLSIRYAKMTGAYIGMEADMLPPPVGEHGQPVMYQNASEDIKKRFDVREEKATRLRKWELASRSKKSLDAFLELAKSEPSMTVKSANFDADDHLINCLNGILDLKTLTLREHDRWAYMTKITTVNYNPYAKCPEWEKFMYKVMLGDESLVAYIQQIIGMGLTGERFEDVFPVYWGNGSNGKTVHQEVLREILGTYGEMASSEMFLSTKDSGNTFESSSLVGIRMLFKDETKEGRQLDEGTVKTMTGGSAIRGEHKFKDQFTFLPKFTSILSTNHKPRITGNDDGIWRRVKLIPWKHSFLLDPDALPKPEVYAQLRKEHEGIFSWAVAGLYRMWNTGYFEPESVKGATQEYRESSDDLGAFISEELYTGNAYEMFASELYKLYVEWTKSSGGLPVKAGTLRDRLAIRGIEQKRKKTGIVYVGIRTRDKLNEPIQGVPQEKEEEGKEVPF